MKHKNPIKISYAMTNLMRIHITSSERTWAKRRKVNPVKQSADFFGAGYTASKASNILDSSLCYHTKLVWGRSSFIVFNFAFSRCLAKSNTYPIRSTRRSRSARFIWNISSYLTKTDQFWLFLVCFLVFGLL